MQQQATILPYYTPPPVRRRPVVLLLFAGAVAQFGLLFLVSFYRVDWLAWGLGWPLFPLASALNVPGYFWFWFLLGPLNGLCWSLVIMALVSLPRRLRPAA